MKRTIQPKEKTVPLKDKDTYKYFQQPLYI